MVRVSLGHARQHKLIVPCDIYEKRYTREVVTRRLTLMTSVVVLWTPACNAKSLYEDRDSSTTDTGGGDTRTEIHVNTVTPNWLTAQPLSEISEISNIRFPPEG